MPTITILLILSILLPRGVCSQIIFTVDDFSRDYYGKISVEDTTEVFMKGWIAIYEKKTGSQIIKVTSDELAFDHSGPVRSNVHELPYGEQSVIMYDDFNFDGVKDFAIEDGQHSAYHGPSFRIYLAAGGKFVFNKAFTRLAQEYTGMFGIDSAKKEIYTMTKSGCCWHEFSVYTVSSNRPKPLRIFELDSQEMPFITETEITWEGSRKRKEVTQFLDPSYEDLNVLLSFELDNQKRIMVFMLGEQQILYYALTDTSDKIELLYPPSAYNKLESEKFNFRNGEQLRTLRFNNKGVAYVIHESANTLGVTVKTSRIVYELTGLQSSKKGTLQQLASIKLDNLVIEK